MTDFSKVNTVKNRADQLDAELEALTKKPEVEEKDDTNPKNENGTVDWSKRYSDLRSHSDKQVNDLKKQLQEKEKQLLAKDKGSLPATEEEFTAWIERYPDVARMFETLILKKSPGVPTELIEEVKTLKEDRHALARERAFDQLLKVHPDFLDIRETDEFKDWFEAKRVSRSRIDNQIYSAVFEQDTDGFEAARAVTEFKNSLKSNKKTKTDDDAAFVPGNKSQTRPAETDTNKTYKFKLSDIEKMDIREYEKFESEIDQARRDGKILDDLGAAF